MPSRSNASAISALDSGSSGPRIRSRPSTTVTRLPNRANICASSSPIAPPPSTTSDSGTVVVAIASRLVQYGVPSSPGIGGTTGADPVAMTMPRRVVNVVSPTTTRPGPSRRALSRTSRPPFFSNRSAATWSFQSSVASSRMRFATGAKSGSTVAVPETPSMRRASASRLAPRIIILLGMQPQ